MKKETLITRIILWSIIIIPLIVLLICALKYEDLGYDMGEFTGYTLEIKCCKEMERVSNRTYFRYKQMYNITENDYISESLEKNLKNEEMTIETVSENLINSYNRIILEVKQLNENDVTVSIINRHKEISLKYGEEYKFHVDHRDPVSHLIDTKSSYKIKINRVQK